jgi:hypothetical protein
MGSNHRVFNRFGCFLCGSLAVLLCVAPEKRDGHVNAALAPLDAIAALTHSDAAPAGPELRTALTDPDARTILVDPVIKVPLAEPEANVSPLEASDQCVLTEECIDQYLWSVYERAPKADTIKVEERLKVKVEKDGKSRTVTKTVTKFVNEDFTWKDPDAAEKAGMSVAQYVIGGMDPGFKVRLYRLFRALDDAGFAPGMTSGFRDDYRQSITSGNKAVTGYSYHGGSRRGGYGHGLAADVVSVKGDTRSERCSSSERMWKWIDDHGGHFGIGRPYLDKDPPHIAPIDGKEYADKRGGDPKAAEKEDTATDRDAKVAKLPQALRSRRALQEFRAANGISEGDAGHETSERLLRVQDAKAANKSDINFVGGWGSDLAECRESPIKITARRAEAFGTACEFHSTQRKSPNIWQLRAECASKTERWNANIRFTVSTSKLTWASERGTTTYLRCPIVSASR